MEDSRTGERTVNDTREPLSALTRSLAVKLGGCGQEAAAPSWVVALSLNFDYGVLGCGCG
jgi:hypothetical protein